MQRFFGRSIAAFAGRYDSEMYGSLTVVRNGAKLDATIGPASYPAQLSHWSGDTFRLIPTRIMTDPSRHPRESGGPGLHAPTPSRPAWIPAFAGMTEESQFLRRLV